MTNILNCPKKIAKLSRNFLSKKKKNTQKKEKKEK